MRFFRNAIFLFVLLRGVSIPAVDVVVEMHQDEIETELRYRVGAIDAETRTVDWGEVGAHDDGRVPSVAVDGDLVVEIHQSHEGTNLWYKVGTLDVRTKGILWGDGVKFDAGRFPMVALEGRVVVEVHQSHIGTNLWYHVGVVDTQAKSILWGDAQKYDGGQFPSVALWDGAVVEVHQSGEGERYGITWGPWIPRRSPLRGAKRRNTMAARRPPWIWTMGWSWRCMSRSADWFCGITWAFWMWTERSSSGAPRRWNSIAVRLPTWRWITVL